MDTARRVHLLFSRASLTGKFTDYREVEEALSAAVEDAAGSPWIHLYGAHLNIGLHRLERARRDVNALRSSLAALTLAADIALQEGGYHDAEAGYQAALEVERTWDLLARLAYYRAKTGAPEEAEHLYDEARAILTVKQMRHYAWLELQKGLIDWDHVQAELGEVVLTRKPGRSSSDEVTFFKSVGVAVQDAFAADITVKHAIEHGLGQTVAWS